MRSRRALVGSGAGHGSDAGLADAFDPTVLPAYVEEAIGHYLALGTYLRAMRPLLRDAVIPQFASEDRAALIESYLGSNEDAPLLLALESDIRALLGDPALKAAASARRPRQSPVRAFAVRLGIAARPAAPPPRPALKDLLTTRSTDEKAQLLTASFFRLLANSKGCDADGARRISAFVRLSRFSTTNATRDRKLVESVFAADRAGALALADAVLAGYPLFELEPFVLWAAARDAAVAGHDLRMVALCRRFLEGAAAPALEVEVAQAGAGAALRVGDDAAAKSFANRWCSLDTAAAQPRVALAAATRLSDPPQSAHLLADLCRPGKRIEPAAAALSARRFLDEDQPDRAERILRHALASPSAERADLLAELHNVHVARAQPIGVLDALFAGHGSALRWRRFHPSELLDMGPGSGAIVGGPLVSVLLAAESGGERLATTLNSVLAQSHRSIEVILSTVGDVADPVVTGAADDPRVTLLPGPASSLAYAWNAALAVARGKLVAVAMEGDFWLRDLLVAHVAARGAAPRLLATTALSLSVAPDGTVPGDPLGHHIHPSERAAVLAAGSIHRAGGFEMGLDEPLAEMVGRLALHRSAGATGVIERILTVRLADTMDGDDAEARAAVRRRAANRGVWQERHLESLRLRQLPSGPTILPPTGTPALPDPSDPESSGILSPLEEPA